MSTKARSESPEEQGERLEITFRELIERLIRDDLGLDLIDVIPQPRGAQGGRDLQVKWRNAQGKVRFWHFECKSKGEGVLPEREFADKLIQEALSPHEIDVWCLVLSDAEPSKGSDDVINAAPAKLSLGFSLAVLSQNRMRIKFLYSCHPDLFRRQFDGPPHSLSAKERRRQVEQFGEWLEETSRSRPRGAPTGWHALTPRVAEEIDDDEEEARAYLRGLGGMRPWAAALHDWAVPRHATETSLLSVVEDAEPGFTHEWLVGAGGEGKSTVLSRIAWKAALGGEKVVVFWADEAEHAKLPVEWLERLPPESRVLFCVDGTKRLDGLSHGIGSSQALAEGGVRVVTLLADRGNHWRLRRAHLVRSQDRRDPIMLEPLSGAEQGAVAVALERRGLLHGRSRVEAEERIGRASAAARDEIRGGRPTRSWLLPTVMQLTDSEDRPFDRILASVLEDLEDAGEEGALRLLLTISLLEAAGPTLPPELAERLFPLGDELKHAKGILDAELESQFSVPSKLAPVATGYRTHGAVVSDGFVRVAGGDRGLRSWLLDVCEKVPGLVAEEYDKRTALPQHRFDLLNDAVNYLDGREVKEHEGAATLLAAWSRFDQQGFATWNRLGTAYTHWVQQGASDPASDRVGLEQVVNEVRFVFRRALEAATETLGRHPVAPQYGRYNLADEHRITYRSWALLEATVGTPHKVTLGGRDDLIRSVYLSLIGASTKDRGPTATAGLLARVLDNLGKPDLAAPFAAYLLAVEGRGSPTLRHLSGKVKGAAKKVSEPRTLRISTLADVVLGVLDGHWDVLEVKAGEAEHRSYLLAELKRIARELRTGDVPPELEQALTEG